MRLTRSRALEPLSLGPIALLFGAFSCASPAPRAPVTQASSASVDSDPTPVVSSTPVNTASAEPIAKPVAPAVDRPHQELDAPEIQTAGYLATENASYKDLEPLVRAKKWAEARKALAALAPTDAAMHRYDVHVASITLGARLAALAADTKSSKEEYQKVLDAWKDPDASVLRIRTESTGLADDVVAHRIGAALTGVGEALYANAEEERARTMLIKFPVLKGNPTKDAVLTFTQKEVAPWITKKRAAIDKTETAYRKVVEIQPVAPPRWVIASAERVGSLYQSFATDLLSTPMPKAWADKPEITEAYRSAMSEAMAPFKESARAAFAVCVRMSDAMAIDDDHSRICRAALDDGARAKLH